jgi:regulator of replication initiation timing
VTDETYVSKREITNKNSLSQGHLKKLREEWFHICNTKAIPHAETIGEKLLYNVLQDSSKKYIAPEV